MTTLLLLRTSAALRGARGRLAVLAAASCVLAACGGGGGDAGTPLLPGNGAGSGTSTGTGTGSTTTAAGKLTLALSTSTVAAGSPAVVTATLQTAAGVPVAGQVVTFSTSGGLATLNPASALTDANGQAVVSLVPASAASAGAGVLTANADLGTTKLSATAGFQTTATAVAIESMTSDATSLAPYGQSTVAVRVSGAAANAPVTVNLSSACATGGRATLTPTSVTTTTGLANFTYRDGGCGAFATTDAVQASIAGSASTRSLTLTLASPAVASVAFTSASPATIYLKGTGLVENSTVTFQVRDANGLGLPEREVRLEPTTGAGGLTMDDLADKAAVVKKTDANGNVSVRINAGTVPTPVRVKASLVANPAISTVSSNLAIAVGLPTQSAFSLSQGTFNIEGMNYDGTLNTYTIVASDRLANPVPAGTAINFVAESGQVQPIVFTSIGANGLASATATYQSASPRPADGRITVLAYALGEKSFNDANGNNVYDAGEDWQDLGDVFLDRVFNGVWNAASDQYFSIGGGSLACRDAASSWLKLGSAEPSRPGTCNGEPTTRTYVRRAIQTVLSTSEARPLYGWSPTGAALRLPPNAYVPAGSVCPSSLVTGAVAGIAPVGAAASVYDDAESPAQAWGVPFGAVRLQNMGKSGTFTLLATDANPNAFNPMPAGTVVSASGTDGMTVNVAGGSPVPSTLSPNTVVVEYGFDDVTQSGVVTVSFTSPRGLKTSFPQAILRGAAPAGSVTCP